ncbi:MAG: hypothetical protein FJ396_11230 [Verrucomicrobia bacterium]|nr:hypothetical protein [Verrucomicrobiota bacterium]
MVREVQTDLPGATVLVKLTGGGVWTFVFSALPAPVTLEANQTYDLVSSETAGGDRWYDWNQTVTATGGLSVTSTAWSYPGGPYIRYAGGGLSQSLVDIASVSGRAAGQDGRC